MPLKTSGEISFSEIAGEFFKSPPYRLSDFYRGSLVVPDTELNIGIPTSGRIEFSDFYGTAYAIPPTIPAGAIVFYTGETAPSGWQEYTAAYGRYIKGSIGNSQIGTISEVAIPNGIPQSTTSGTSGAHSGGTFNTGGMGATSGTTRNYPLNSSTPGNHNHVVNSIPRATAEQIAPEPPHAVFKMIKTLTDTQTLPAGSIIISENKPSPAWNSETRVSGSNNIYVKASGMGPGEIDRLTGLPSSMSSTTSTSGGHDHRLASSTRYYNAGTNVAVYAYAVDGNHTHSNANVTVSVLKIKSIAVNLWRSVQNTIGANNTIFMYDGNLDNLPADWYICNGLNGTLDLSDRFIQIGGSNGVQHGVKEENSQLQFQWSTIPSGPNPSTHNHRQDNQYNTYQTYRAAAYHPTASWSHSHTAPATSSQTGNVYSPPAITLGFIQYIKDNANLSSITISQNVTEINEGSSVTISFSHLNYPVGTVIYWDTEAVAGTLESDEFTDNALTGSFTITTINSINSITRTARSDLREDGLEIFKIRFYSDSGRTQLIGASQNITINDTSLPNYEIRVLNTNGIDTVTINEGDTVTFELLTTVLSAGETVYWSTRSTTMNSLDFTDNMLSNGVNLEAFGNRRRALVTRTVKSDSETEGSQSFQLEFRTGATNGTFQDVSNTVAVNDTSLTPTYQSVSASASNLNETSSYSFTFEGTNVPEGGELVYWSIDSYDAGTGESTISDTTDFVERSGSILAPAGTGNRFTVTINGSNDNRTEPNEYFKLSLRRGSTTGTVIANTLLVIQIISTSNATYSLTTSSTSINWGSNVSFTLTRTAGTHGTNTVFYIETTDWLTEDFSTPQIVRHLIGNGSSYTWSVNTRSSTSSSKAGKTFKVNVYNDNPYPSSGTVTASLIASSPTITISPVGYLSISGSPNQSIINEGTQITWTVQTQGFSNGRTVYWGIDFGSGTDNYGAITQNLLAASAATEPYRTLFNTVVSGRRLGDMDNSGSVTANDALIYSNWASNSNSVTTSQAANCQATTTYLVNNSGTYGWAIANPTTSADFTANVLGSGSVNNNQVSITYTLTNDAITEGNEKFRLKVYDNSARTVEALSSVWYSINDTSRTPTITSLTRSTASVNEGSSVTFTATGENHTSTTTYYYRLVVLSGTFNASDVTSGTLDGTISVSSSTQTGSISITLTNDVTTEGAESFRMDLYSNSARTNFVISSASIAVNDTSLGPTYRFGTIPTSINEGSSGTFNIITTNVSNNTRLYWNVIHDTVGTAATDNADFITTTGNFLVSNNAGSFSVTTAADNLTEGTQRFRMGLYVSSVAPGNLVATSGYVDINDTSLTRTYAFGSIPTSINEGASGTFNVNTTNVPNSTVLHWRISHGTSAAADFSTTSNTFTITSNRGSFSVSPTADLTTEGNQTFSVIISLTSGGTAVATSNTVTINDTSITGPGQTLLLTTTATTSRTTTWTAPAGVTSVSVVCIGGGGGGRANSQGSGGGGGGGALSYRNNYTVTPGSSYTVTIGRGGAGTAVSGTGAATSGGSSTFFSASIVGANGGAGGRGSGNTWDGGAGGSASTVTGGASYRGGDGGGGQSSHRAGGGGAGGYSGIGGSGGGREPSAFTSNNATAGAGGAGGGGGYSTATGTNRFGGRGGNVGAKGQGSNGAAGGNSSTANGGAGSPSGTGFYGGGGAGGNGPTFSSTLQNGTPGAVRIMWPGNSRSYPSTRTADE